MARDSRTTTRFSGINTIDSEANTPVHYAVDARNVIASSSGQLWVMRAMSVIIDWSTTAFNFARSVAMGLLDTTALDNRPPRLLIQQGGHLVYTDAPDYTTRGELTGVLAPANPGRLDFAQCNGVLYFSSGTWGGKMLPGDTRYYKWGIVQSTPPSQILATTTGTGPVTVQRTGGVVSLTLPTPVAVFIGDPVYVDTDPSATWDGSFGGTYAITGVAGAIITYAQPGLPDAGPFTRASFPPGLTASVGYQYRGSFMCSLTSHSGTASVPGPVIGPLTDQSPVIFSPKPPADDPSIDLYALWRNLDDGGDWYLIATYPLSAGGPFPRQVAMLDTTTDDTLEASAQTPPYDNGVSPNGKYVMATLDRLVMCGIEGEEDSVAYTGLEAVNFGRPQESWLQFNSIAVGQGQSTPIGLGNCRFGTVIFCTNKVMYILNGTLSDVTTSQVTPLSFTLRELPFKVGTYSHYTHQSTPQGVVFLDDAFKLMIFDGYNPPGPLAPVLQGIIGRMSPGSQDVLTSEFVRYQGPVPGEDREWYILSFPIDGSLTNNFTVILDMTQDAARNTGAWIFDCSIDVIKGVLNPDGTRHLICAQAQTETLPDANPLAGFLTELPFINFRPGDVLMDNAHWRSGFFGIRDEDGVDEWAYFKLFRFVRLMTAQGVTVMAYCVDGDSYTFENPYVQKFDQDSSVYSLNVKTRAVSLDFIFPDGGSGDPISGFTINWIFTGKR